MARTITGTGTINYYNSEKGFGFIHPDGEHRKDNGIFFFGNMVEGVQRIALLGTKVYFTAVEGPRGWKATSVSAVSSDVTGAHHA
jgi:cold shock CspA family protein